MDNKSTGFLAYFTCPSSCLIGPYKGAAFFMYVPQLSEEALQEFKLSYETQYGETLSDAEIKSIAQNFMDIYHSVIFNNQDKRNDR